MTVFEVDFSVSHHESISVNGTSLDQSPLTEPQAVPDGLISSTDDPGTGTGVADPATDVTDPVASNVDLHFETGLLEVHIPTEISISAAPISIPTADPKRPVPAPEPAAVAQVIDRKIVPFISTDIELFPATSYSPQSEYFFQLRQNSTEPVEGFEHIDSDVGWKLLKPRRLKEWVYANDLDGTGYELWLINTKVKDGQTITFERPVLRFDVFDNQPCPKAEDLPDQLPELKLERVYFDEDGNLIDSPSAEPEEEDARENETDDQSTDTSSRLPDAPIEKIEAASSAAVSSSRMAQSAMTGLMVSECLKRRQKRRDTTSHLCTVSHIINRVSNKRRMSVS